MSKVDWQKAAAELEAANQRRQPGEPFYQWRVSSDLWPEAVRRLPLASVDTDGRLPRGTMILEGQGRESFDP